MTKILASFDNVGFRYKRSEEILKNITLNIHPGDFYFLTGNSGAGKTSLLRLLYLSNLPSRGTLKIFETNVHKIPHKYLPLFRRNIGVVFQDFRLLRHLNSFDNVALPLRILGFSEKNIYQNVNELLDWVGLSKHLKTLPNELSGGQQQRLAIARAIINKPSLLIADEPTGNVDDEMAERLLNLFKELNHLGTTVIIATHNEHLIHHYPYSQLHLSFGSLLKIEASPIGRKYHE